MATDAARIGAVARPLRTNLVRGPVKARPAPIPAVAIREAAMLLYLIRRILYAVPIALAVGFFCFMLATCRCCRARSWYSRYSFALNLAVDLMQTTLDPRIKRG
jgi:hypothetical protein